MNKKKSALMLGLLCGLLTLAIILQINTIKRTSSSGVSSNYKEDGLRDEVFKWKERYESTSDELEKYEKELDSIRQEVSKDSETSSSKVDEISKNNNLLGLTDLEGKGIELTISDDPDATRENISVLDDISNHIVHDGDLRRIVNELKNAGAEAISINGQRVVLTTAITCIGNVIKINDEKVSSPFVIKAIGFPERMDTALNRAGGYLQLLNDYGIATTTKRVDKLQVNKYSGVLSTKYFK